MKSRQAAARFVEECLKTMLEEEEAEERALLDTVKITFLLYNPEKFLIRVQLFFLCKMNVHSNSVFQKFEIRLDSTTLVPIDEEKLAELRLERNEYAAQFAVTDPQG